MSITAYKVEAVGHDRTGEDYGYVNIMYRYGNKQSCPQPDQCEKIEVMWADESVYGPPAPGSKVGDFIKACSWQQGGRLYTDMADGLLGLRSIYPPGDCPAADGYLHRSEAQGTGVV